MAYIDNVTNILQIQPDGLPTFVRLSQNENGRNLYFQLAGNEIDIPANSTITISGTKPDGTVYSGTGSISDNVILIPEMIQMTAVAGYWDAKVKIISGGNTIATGRIRFVIDADTVDPDSVPSDSELEGLVAEAQQYAETARTEAYGSPLTATTAAGMTDHTRVYVYTGSETGYTAGHWYYWDGTQWTDGGIYNSTAVNTDPTLTLAGVAADAKATGDAIEAARVAIDDTLTNEGEAADAAAVGSEISGLKEDLNTKANIEGSYETLTAGQAEQLLSDSYAEDQVPYLFRKSGGSAEIGNRETDMLVGGTVAWNQLANFASDTSQQNNGVTYVINADGSIACSGTASADSVLNIGAALTGLQDHVLFISGCPKGGSISTYFFRDGYNATVSTYDIGNGKITIGKTKFVGQIKILSGVNADGLVFKPQSFDLTQMFGSTIANYIYNLEQATAGAGVEFFRKLFPKDYYEYNAGELISVSGVSAHEMTGFNLWDEEWEVGGYDFITGEKISLSDRIRSKNFISIISGDTYYIGSSVNATFALFYYDADKNFITRINVTNGTFVVPTDVRYLTFAMATVFYGTTYNHDICINLSSSRNGEYEPYKKHSYPLDDSLTLRGIPKLDSNNQLYYDGDTYEHDGTVTRRYGVVDLGTLNWTMVTIGDNTAFYNNTITNIAGSSNASGYAICSRYLQKIGSAQSATDKQFVLKSSYAGSSSIFVVDNAYSDAATFKAAISGVMLVYELATPTTETADAYPEYQVVDKYGAEEYVSTSIVPVGHVTKYYENLTQKIERLPKDFSTLIAPTEVTYTATRNYTTGSLFIVNNILYKATANIANGGSITPGTNCIATTLAEIISALS